MAEEAEAGVTAAEAAVTASEERVFGKMKTALQPAAQFFLHKYDGRFIIKGI